MWWTILCCFQALAPSSNGFEGYSRMVEFGKLELSNNPPSHFADFEITKIEEDQLNPGSFLLSSGSALLRYSPSSGLAYMTGNRTQTDFKNGKALEARYNDIADFIQHKHSRIAIADRLNGCIRELNLDNNMVKTIIGDCNYEPNPSAIESIPSLGDYGQNVSASLDILDTPIWVIFVKSKAYYLVYDATQNSLIKVDVYTKTAELLEIDGQLGSGVLLDTEENFLYVTYSSTLSKIELDTLAVELIVGNLNDELTKEPLLPGPFATANVGVLRGLQWLLPDHYIIAHSESNNALVAIDLLQYHVEIVCTGANSQTQTSVGNIDVCELKSPTSLIYTNGILLVSVSRQPYRRHSYSEILKIPVGVTKTCSAETPTGLEEYVPPRKEYNVTSKVQLECPAGYGIKGLYNSMQCTLLRESEGSVIIDVWSRPVPHCSNNLKVTSLEPKSGLQSGGTQITVRGTLPNRNMSIALLNRNISQKLEIIRDGVAIKLTMPPQNFTGIVKIEVHLTSNLTENFVYEYLPDPTILNGTVVNIASGGIPAQFELQNVNSAHVYTLNLQNEFGELEKKKICDQQSMTIFCKLPSLEEYRDFSSRNITAFLLADGNRLAPSYKLTILPDPVFNELPEPATMQFDQRGATLTLYGSGLQLGLMNMHYKVELSGSNAASSVECMVIQEGIKNETLPCYISNHENLSMNSLLDITVTIGNLVKSLGKVKIPKVTRSSVQARPAEKDNLLVIVMPAVGLSIIILIIIGAIIHKQKQQKTQLHPQVGASNSTEQNISWFAKIDPDLSSKVQELMIDSEDLTTDMSDSIGRGNFGVVYKGHLRRGNELIVVAVKTLKVQTDGMIETVKQFFEEAVILQGFNHVNVMDTIGISWSQGAMPRVVLPYMKNGDLRSFIRRSNATFKLSDLLNFAKQVACGMEYLSSNKFVHRDLAARNCLVNEECIVKVSDFGLSRDVYNKDYYRLTRTGTPLPVKWMAMESLQSGVFDARSDVWSFGVLMWELCTRGSEPYAEVNHWSMKTYLERGNRLPIPPYIPEIIYDKMRACWEADPDARPSFMELDDFLALVLNKSIQLHCGRRDSEYSYAGDHRVSSISNNGFMIRVYEDDSDQAPSDYAHE